ncbi:hypothetical protein MJO28_004239 [Puccinia striiformis f. sp. tritici]|uniref:Uncharacterized protein n=1 Tax=Puccinia striiformis f. sp. tritici TaxID=168172 RepID=A0ACC0ENU8_9BASI|nr:hypothetical protein MJO28_004239 [Puccinia striiformis f. sp. tritici]
MALPVIPDELLEALAREQQQQQQQQTTATVERETTIWNRIGLTTQSSHSKRNSTKQQQQQQPPPTSAHRTRASFSFDHYLQSHLTNPNNLNASASSASSTKAASRSRFLGSEIINGIFSSKPLEIIDQPKQKPPSRPPTGHQTEDRDRWASNHPISVTLEDEVAEDDLLMAIENSNNNNNNQDQNDHTPWDNRETFTHEIHPRRPNDQSTATDSDSEFTAEDHHSYHHSHPRNRSETPAASSTPKKKITTAKKSSPKEIDSSRSTPFVVTASTTSSRHVSIPGGVQSRGEDNRSRSRSQSVFSASSNSNSTTPTTTNPPTLPTSNKSFSRPTVVSGGLRQQIEARRALLLSNLNQSVSLDQKSITEPFPPPQQQQQQQEDLQQAQEIPAPFTPTSPLISPTNTSQMTHNTNDREEQQIVTTSYTVPSTDLNHNKRPPTCSRSRSFSDTFIRKTKSLIGIHPPFPSHHHRHHLPSSFSAGDDGHRYSLNESSSSHKDHNTISSLQSFNLTKIVNNSSPRSLKVMTTSSSTPKPLKKQNSFRNLKISNLEIDSSSNTLDRVEAQNGSVATEEEEEEEEEEQEEEEEEEEGEGLCLVDSPEVREALQVKADFVIGVAGPKGVGKSTIIHKALRNSASAPLCTPAPGLGSTLTSTLISGNGSGSSSSSVVVVLYEDANSGNRITSMVTNIVNQSTGNSKVLQVLEIDQDLIAERFVKNHVKQGFLWPNKLPHLDGVLLCYDAMDPHALDHLRPLLHSFWTRGGISLIVLACKADKDEKKNATSPLKAAELVNVYGTGMIQLDGGLDDPNKKMRNSFNWIVKTIKEARGEHRSYSSASSTNILSSISGDEGPSRTPSIVKSSPLKSGKEAQGSSPSSEVVDLLSKTPTIPPAGILPRPEITPRKLTPPCLNLVDNNHHTPPRSNSPSVILDSHHLDDTDGDSFSNNALVAMSYEKSTRPDGSFMHGGSTPGSPQEAGGQQRKSNVLDPQSVSEGLRGSSLPRPSSSSSGSPEKKVDNTTSTNPHGLPGSSTATTVPSDPVITLGGSGKHAVQKAIAMSQRGADMDSHFEKQVIIDKFVFATVSGNEPSFVDQFLIVFRRFATPFEVLSALISRFEFVSAHIQRDPILGRYAHLKICHVLMSWLEIYPGDFVQPATLTVLKAFNSLLVSVTWLLHYAIEIMPMIKTIGNMTDEDVGWALPDTTDESALKAVLDCVRKLQLSLAPPPPPPPSSAASRGSVGADAHEDPALPTTPLTTGISLDGSMAYPHSDASPHVDTFPSNFMSTDHVVSTAASSPVNSFSPQDQQQSKSTDDHKSNDHLHHPLSSLDSTENFIASTLPLKSTLTSSTFQSDHKSELKALLDSSVLLLSIPEEAIALQITRLEWNIFSQMKPRHLIRYVLAPRDPNNPRKALRDPNSPIAKSTDYLNYLAVWASSMILIHDKLKSRARVLLKLMKVAYELRDMDDFHSLMGVLAGIEAQPVYRLDATFEIVQHMDLQSYRRYLSLKKLMSSQRSFSAYRLARQTASSQCVPYLGTYLQDITAVNEVKNDMKDGKVNLTKMIQIAKSASSVLNCNLLAPKIVFDPRISNLIIKIPVLSEDSQYELSYKYKPRLQSSHHHSSHPVGNSSSGVMSVASGSLAGGMMSVLSGATTTGMSITPTGSNQPDPSVQPTSASGVGLLSSSVSSGSLIPTSSLSTSPSTGPTTPIPASSSTTTTTPTTTSGSAIHSVANVGAATSLVAKKGTRKLKQLLSITHNSSNSNSNLPSNEIAHSQHHP